jgi:hypothetical protein
MPAPTTDGRRRPVQADDVLRLRVPLDPQVSPDGRRVVFTLRLVDPATRRAISNLWIAERGEEARPLTTSLHKDHTPRRGTASSTAIPGVARATAATSRAPSTATGDPGRSST